MLSTEPVRTDYFWQGYLDVMRSDFAVEPSQDAVVFRGPGMIVVTLDQPPSPELLREFNMLRDRVSPVDMGNINQPAEPFKLGQQSFYIPLRDTFCPDQTSEAIASELESRYGMRVLRKRSKPMDRKFGSEVVKRFTKRSDAFNAGYAATFSA